MSSIVAIPTQETSSRRTMIWAFSLASVFCIGGVKLMMYMAEPSATKNVTGSFYTVTTMDLEVRLVKDGELQAVNNIDVTNRVEGINTIQELVKEGTSVHKGDILVVLDSSLIQKAYDSSLLELQNAKSALTTAVETKEIQEAANKASLKAAELDRKVSGIDQDEYMNGLAPQKEAEARTKVQMTEITVKNKEEDLATTRNLFSKGFVTAVDVKKAELDLMTAQNDLTRAKTELRVLLEYTHKKLTEQKSSDVAQSELKVERVRKENAALLNRYTMALNIARQQLDLRQQLTDKLKDQLENCTIKAPADGMVIYASSSERSGVGEPIKEGGNVRNMQVLLRLPDTSQMKAVIRVQEGQVPRLRVDDNNPMRANVSIVGQKNALGASLAKISVLADSSQRWWNPDLKEYPVELLLDETPTNCKPGMGCTVEIQTDRRAGVLAVPLTTIYTQGTQSFVFVRDGSKVNPQEVQLGVMSDTHAEVRVGLKSGDNVLMLQPGQGRSLLEKANIKIDPPARNDVGARSPRPKRNGSGSGGGPRTSIKIPAHPATQPAVAVKPASAAPRPKHGQVLAPEPKN